MPEQLFYGVNLGSVVEHMRGKGVAQHVGAFFVQSGYLAQIFVDKPIDEFVVNRLAFVGDKQKIVIDSHLVALFDIRFQATLQACY